MNIKTPPIVVFPLLLFLSCKLLTGRERELVGHHGSSIEQESASWSMSVCVKRCKRRRWTPSLPTPAPSQETLLTSDPESRLSGNKVDTPWGTAPPSLSVPLQGEAPKARLRLLPCRSTPSEADKVRQKKGRKKKKRKTHTGFRCFCQQGEANTQMVQEPQSYLPGSFCMTPNKVTQHIIFHAGWVMVGST